MAKLSAYTHEAKLPDGRVLLANLLWQSHLELDPVEQEAWSAYKKGETAALPQELSARLGSGKFLLDEDFDELQHMRRHYRDSRHSRHVLGLTIAPTIDCNLACIYCYENKRKGLLTAETERHIRSYVETMIEGRKFLSIIWYGGEPLMCRDRVLSLSRFFRDTARAAQAGYSAQMTTNALLLDKMTADAMAEIGHWTNIQITMDGSARYHDQRRPARGGQPTFARIYDNVVQASDRLPISLRMNVDTANIDGCLELIEQLASDADPKKLHVYFAPVHFFGKGCRDIADSGDLDVFDHDAFSAINLALVRRARELGFKTNNELKRSVMQQCQAVSTHSIVIEPDGGLHRCWTEVGEDDKRVGHIAEPVVLDAPNALRWLRFDPTVSEPCRSCDVLPTCFGGCPQRHLDGRPITMICSGIRFNTRATILSDYIAAYRPDLAGAAAAKAKGRCAACATG